MDVKSVCLSVLVLSLQLVRSQQVTSPCPGVFDFDKEGNDGSKLYGNINLLKPVNKGAVSGLEVRINFTVAGAVLNNYKGNILPITPNPVRKYNQGQVVKYRVLFPPTEMTPKVTGLLINEDTICQGSGDELGEHVSGLSLRHKSKGGFGSVDNLVTSSFASRPMGANTPIHRQEPPLLPSSGNRVNSPITTDECGLVAGGNQGVPLISNGLSYERGEIPWLVAIYRSNARNLIFTCGGTLVTDRHVVTAAHCIKRPGGTTPNAEILLKLGGHKLNYWSDDITVTRMVMDAKIYEEYDPTTLRYDISILTMDKRVTFNRFIRPACLWSGDTDLLRVVGTTGVVAGWGDRGVFNTGLNGQDEPQKAHLPIVSTSTCRASKSDFHLFTNNNTLCAGDRKGVGPCTGDSGGGLYMLEDGKWRLRGVVSVSLQNDGYLLCNLNEYIVFTDTAQFLPWIRNILSIKYND